MPFCHQSSLKLVCKEITESSIPNLPFSQLYFNVDIHVYGLDIAILEDRLKQTRGASNKHEWDSPPPATQGFQADDSGLHSLAFMG